MAPGLCGAGEAMTDFELIPAIDLKGGKCVRLQEGDMARSTEYADEPVSMALHWQQEGASLLHLVDLDGAFSGDSTHLEVAREIFRRLNIPVQFGGGIRTLAQVERVFELGAARVILGTAAAEDPMLIDCAVSRWPGRVVAGIDARQGRVALRGWVEQTGILAVDLVRKLVKQGIDRVVYTDVSRDGMLRGANVEETEAFARAAGIRVIASGGVSSEADVRELWKRRSSGIEGVILGRALYEKRIDLRSLRRGLCGCETAEESAAQPRQ